VFRIGPSFRCRASIRSCSSILFEQQRGTILDMFNMFSGGALERLSLFALGIMPYISASIIMQLLTHTVPSARAAEEGRRGRPRKITQYTRYGTVGWRPSRPSGFPSLQSQSVGGYQRLVTTGLAVHRFRRWRPW
jgi:preprotein translocase subunit SecY